MGDADPATRLNAALEGRYRIERELGEGGMATVYLADDLRHERKVALKVLKPELAAVVGAERFLAEIKTTANLQHPHILPLFDSGEADGFLFYVMPYVAGESLRERLDRDHQLPVDEAVQVAVNVAEALDYAHSQGVIHRDIKPANILLQAGKPLVSDFGIALALSAGARNRLTETGLSLGTPHYMSPEQATGDLSVGAPTDVYALGCVLYEMLVGEPPYTGSTPQAILGKIIAGEAASVAQHRTTVPAHVDSAIRKALEKVPADRFLAARDFARALGDSGLRRERLDPVGSSSTRRLWNPLSATLAATTLALSVVVAWVASRQPATFAPSRFELTLPADMQRAPGVGPSMTVSPDGSVVIVRARAGGRGAALWMRPLGSLTPSVAVNLNGASDPSFSPDGESLAYTSANGELVVASLVGAPSRTIVDESVQYSQGGVAWSPDGAWLYYQRQGQGIWRVPAMGGDPEGVTSLTGDESAHTQPDVLPGGLGLLYTRVREDESEIVLRLLDTGDETVLFDGTFARFARSGHVVFVTPDGSLRAAPFDVGRMEVTGAAREVLDDLPVSRSPTGYFSISHTGVLAYSPSRPLPERVPVWVRSDGTVEELDPTLRGAYEAPSLSPDGSKVALELLRLGAPRQIWIYDVEGGTLAPLSSEGDNRRPFWSPDGARVGFVSARGSDFAVYERTADFSGEDVMLQAAPGIPIQEALWTPDGTRLVLRQGSGLARSMYVAPPHPDSTARPLFDAEGVSVWGPSLSADGQWLAYASNESGSFEVWVRAFPEAAVRTQISLNGGSAPVWDRELLRLYYQSPQGHWVVATLSVIEGRIGVESRQELASTDGMGVPNTTQHFDVAPGGGTILALRRQDDPGGSVPDIIVQDFFDELNRAVPVD